MNGAAPRLTNSIDAFLEDEVLMVMHLDLLKTFPDIPCVSNAWRPFFAARRYEEVLTCLLVSDEADWSTGNVGISTAN